MRPCGRGACSVAFDVQELFRRHSQELKRFLRRRGHSAETAADITQDTFLRVLASPPAEVCSNHNPRAYLYQVSRNLSVNHQRRESLIQTTDLDDAVKVADPAPSAETVVYSRQCLAQTRQALAELPERTRMAFEMHRLGERTIQEVAAELNLSIGRTWELIREAYRHLLTRVDDI
jgi:RNA polymerase sigma-70 factor, ECF subfamily